jgi:hypothetical protein
VTNDRIVARSDVVYQACRMGLEPFRSGDPLRPKDCSIVHPLDMFRGGAVALIVALSPVVRGEAAEALPPTPVAPSDAKAGAFRHLEALQEIASTNGGTRASGTPGYDRSADYVAEKLKSAGYVVRGHARSIDQRLRSA